MKQILPLLLLLLPCGPAMAATPEEQGLAIAIEADRRDTGFGNYTSDVKMILRNKQGQESTREIRSKTLEVEGDGDKTKMSALARQLAMHVAATNPVALDLDGVPADVLEREKAILADKNKGKPDNILEKIVQSGLKSYAKEHCLLEQAFIHDPSKSVTQALNEAEKDIRGALKVVGFLRFALGEGIEKKEDDFAAEVAAAAGKG